MQLTRRITLALAVVASLVGTSVTTGTTAHADNPSYLFSVQAAGGSTTSVHATSGEDERFTLTLHGVDPVTKFADRPFRNASVISPAALATNWGAWFAGSPPNAVLTFVTASGMAPQSIVVTLTRPHYSSAGRVLSFTATRTYRTQDPSQKGSDWARPATPHLFRSASLFIDNASAATTAAPLVAQLQASMRPYIFAANDALTWSAVERALSGVLTQAWQQGRLLGPSAASSYTVSCQPTPQQILGGYLTCNVGLAVQKPAMFYNVILTQQMGSSG